MILVNIFGTKNLATLSSKYKINRFVMISTDKAVKSYQCNGSFKRGAELLVQALQDVPGNTTKFITTRFGNVLGSNGSCHFTLKSKSKKRRNPVTITHPDIVRIFYDHPRSLRISVKWEPWERR